MTKRVIILGAAGRDFHDFNVLFRDNADYTVVGFTATQIPNITDRRYPSELAGYLYPDGIPIFPESELERVIAEHAVELAVFAYSDVSHEHVMHLAARCVAAGTDYLLPGDGTMLPSRLPVVAVTATRTGAGKSQTSRAIRRRLVAAGKRVAAVRHPMPYGDLVAQRVQRFASFEDFDAADVTIEEREEYEPYVREGAVIFAGVDYGAILRRAESEADVIIWDGGNNDLPFYRPDVHVCVVDPHRPGHGMQYWPGEANLRRAGVVIINKVDTAPADGLEQTRAAVASLAPTAAVIEAASPITIEDEEAIAGKRVLVVEDGPTLTHGGMGYGAGVVAARDFGAAELIDPRPFAVGSIAETFAANPHIGPLLPAMGYGDVQRAELRDTILRSEPDVVVVGTPIDLMAVLELDLPATRVFYDLEIRSGPTIDEVLAPVM
jgi:predicted GTPase